jgi:outer membrane protein
VDNSISNQVGVRVSQRLIDFGDAKLARREASANRDAAGEDVNQARLDAALGTALAWLDHSEAKAQIERTQDRERFFQEQLDAVDAALEQGGATRTERATVASQLADAEGFGLELTFRRDRAATELRIDTQSQTVPCTDPQSVSRMALRVPTAELAAARALSNNPRLQALRDRAEASESASKRQKRARLPVISVVATGSYASFNRFENFEFRDRVGVDVSVPLYSGGALRAQSRQGEARASVARNQLLDAERRIEENARIARQRIESLQRRLRARTEFEYQTRLQFEAAEIERTAGTQTLRELVEIRLEYETASLQRIRTQYDIYREQLALLALSGDLLG